MRGDRARGVVLYGCAAALLTAGGTWWLLAAPDTGSDPRVERWTRAAERLLPDAVGSAGAGTLSLTAGADREVVVRLRPAEYSVRVVCVGDPGTRVRVSLGAPGSDSGMGLACGEDSDPAGFRVSTAAELRLSLSVTDAGPVVFRYAVVGF